MVDEFTHECLATRVERRLTSHDVLWAQTDFLLEYGIPEHIRSDNEKWPGEIGQPDR